VGEGTGQESGTGSGHAAAVLSRCALEVFTVERIASLTESARSRLQALGYHNVTVHLGDRTLGWQEHALYRAVVVTAGVPERPGEQLSQLAPQGRSVIPVGPTQHLQTLIRVRRGGRATSVARNSVGVRFVPLLGIRRGEGES
jgi:protein-L-isoaspartate(D-aspartate) O-methyltransferase